MVHRTCHVALLLLLLVVVVPMASWSFVVPTLTQRHSCHKSSTTSLKDSELDDSAHAAAPLPLTASDLQRLTALKSRHKTIPLMIMDAMVPGQTISFESADPKFHSLVTYVLSKGVEIGMIGLNPHTGRPLNVGVTLPVTAKNVHLDEQTLVVTLHVQAKRRFEVQGEPWLYKDSSSENNNSQDDDAFYMADVEIVDDRPEDALPDEVAVMTQNLANQIPLLIGTWVHHLVVANKADALKMEARMVELGPLPTEWKDQALWVAALLNPTSSYLQKHQQQEEERVCLEIRPAMLACKNDHDRILLATAALQSSIDHVSGKRRLF